MILPPPPREHWAMSGDICDDHNFREEGAPGTEWVGGVGVLLNTPQCPGWPPTEDDPALNWPDD